MQTQLAVLYLWTEAANFAQRAWSPLVCREQIDQLKNNRQNPLIFLMFKYRVRGTYRHPLCPRGSSLSRIAHNALYETIASYLKSSVTILCRTSFWAQKVPPELTTMVMQTAHTLKPLLLVSGFLWSYERSFFFFIFQH